MTGEAWYIHPSGCLPLHQILTHWHSLPQMITMIKKLRNWLRECRTAQRERKRRNKRRKLLAQYAQCNHIEVDERDLHRIDISIQGKNNTLIINKLRIGGGNGALRIQIAGDGNHVVLGEDININISLFIAIGQIHRNFGPVSHVSLTIGARTGFEEAQIITFNSNASIEIGERCMFSHNINLYHTDGHPIFDYGSGKVINKVKKMKIGNHVWVGAHATITKNVTIADDCIVGWGSVVGKSFTEPHCVLAGNPARIVRQNITWDACGAKFGYITNE